MNTLKLLKCLLTPNLRKGIERLKELKNFEYTWATLNNEASEEKFSY